MATYSYVISANHNIYPNLTVYDVFRDGVLTRHRLNANEGYVFYDSTANDVEPDPITGEDVPVTYYYTEADLPLTYPWANFPYVAVLRSEVDENFIFGVGDNDHEVM